VPLLSGIRTVRHFAQGSRATPGGLLALTARCVLGLQVITALPLAMVGSSDNRRGAILGALAGRRIGSVIALATVASALPAWPVVGARRML
jgi:hypothetical protein